MEQKKVMANDTVPYLPQEIMTNIMARLPVKSLIRFQCVRKNWKNLFKTPYFIFTDYCHLCLLTREKQVLQFQSPPIVDSLIHSRRMVYSSNELLCVHLINKSQQSFLLWNPAIRDIRQVPKSLNHHKAVKFSIGFGYSPIVNDYKIVQILKIHHLGYQVEVYALTKGLWRKVDLVNFKGVNLINHNGFTYNGAIFWFGTKQTSKRFSELIVSFDIATEVFSLMPFPTSAALSFDRLTVYDNKLAMLTPTPVQNSESCLIDLWVMEECADPSKEGKSWTKIYRSKPYPCWLRPMIIWENEIVCIVDAMSKMSEREFEGEVENDEAKAIFCNITNYGFNMFVVPKCIFAHGIVDYVESMVPVDNILREEP